MSIHEIQLIQPNTIAILPVNVGIVLESAIQKYTSMPTEQMPIVRIAKVGQKVYAINHYDIVDACKRSNKQIRCIVETFGNISDVMVQHFRDVISNDVINTPTVYRMVDILQEKLSTTKTEVLKLLGIDKNQYGRLLLTTGGNNMSELAVTELEKLVNELSQRKSIAPIQASIPQYVLEKISRISDVSQQLTLIHFIQSDLQKKSDSRLFWMTPEQIDSITQMIRQNATHAEHKREDSTVAEFVKLDEIGKKPKEEKISSEEKNDAPKEKTKQNKKNKPKKPTHKTRQILDTIPNMIVIPDKKGDPEYLVDKKTSAVSKIDTSSNKEIIKTEQMPSKKLYSIPFDVAKFLGLGDEEDDSQTTIHHKNISGINGLQSFIESQKDQTQRYTIFWNAQ